MTASAAFRALVATLALLAGCAPRPAAQLAPPELQATRVPPDVAVTAHVAPDSAGVLTAWLDFANATAQDVELSYGACAFAVQLAAAGDTAAVWQSEPAGPRACIMIAFTATVPANGATSLSAGQIAASDGIAAPPSGRWTASILLQTDGRQRRIPAGTVTVP